MEHDLTRSDEQHFKYTEVEMLQAERKDCSWLRCSHLAHMSCTKHHGDITIEILAEKHPKTIYNMVAFEFYKHSCNSTEFQGAECKNCTTCILKKGQMAKPLSPCNSLEEITQNPYMAWAILNLNKLDKNSKK